MPRINLDWVSVHPGMVLNINKLNSMRTMINDRAVLMISSLRVNVLCSFMFLPPYIYSN